MMNVKKKSKGWAAQGKMELRQDLQFIRVAKEYAWRQSPPLEYPSTSGAAT